MMIDPYLIIALVMAFAIVLIRLITPFIKSKELIIILSHTDLITRLCLVLTIVYYVTFKILDM